MKVLIVTPWYPNARRPADQLFIRDHATASGMGHDVRVLHLDWNDGWRERPITPPHVTRIHVPGGELLAYALSLVAVVAGVLWIAARHRFIPDLVHGHVYKVGPHAWLASKLLRVPWVHTEHWTWFERGKVNGRQLAIARWSYSRADRVLPVSDHLERVLRRCGIEARYEVVWNNVDTATFTPPMRQVTRDGVVRLLTVGIDPDDNKNIAGILDAYSQLASDNWHATFVGDATGRSVHEQLAVELGVADRVTFVGKRPRDEVADLMRSHDVLVHGSRVETFSVAVGEALCAGLPVVAYDTGAIREMVDLAGAGVVVDDLGRLSDAVGQVIDEAGTHDRVAISTAVRSLLSLDRLAGDLDRVYGSLVQVR